jgi:competence CoiA-like predicted nuclease
LKLWTSKNIVLCPICNKPYEYCHGEFKIPYFRHKEKDKCEDVYSEPETEEHIKGKRDLFEWVKGQNNVTDSIIEGWIFETHQRPDIMFKYKGEQFVIEYQCTPIASEYVKRHDLYKAAGISDIWILGTSKYIYDAKSRGKTIEGNVKEHYIVDNEKRTKLSYCKNKI